MPSRRVTKSPTIAAIAAGTIASYSHPTDGDDLEPEDRAGDRRAEDRAEAAGDAGREELAARLLAHAEAVRDLVGEARAHLHGGPLATRAAAEHMREDACR